MDYKLGKSKFSSIYSLASVFFIGNYCREKANHLQVKFSPLQQANTRSALKAQVLLCCHVFSGF